MKKVASIPVVPARRSAGPVKSVDLPVPKLSKQAREGIKRADNVRAEIGKKASQIRLG